MIFAPVFIFAPILLLLSMNSMPDFDTRAKEFGIASEPEVLKVLKQYAKPLFLDVRSDEEIAATDKVLLKSMELWKQSVCTPQAAPELEDNPASVVGDDKDAPIIVYCGSGKRACKAKEVLESKGYTNVVNAGGVVDIEYLKEDQK